MVITLERLLYTHVFHIDTNLINSRQKPSAVNQLERWGAVGVILINMAGTAREVALAGGDVRRTQKAIQHVFAMTPPAAVRVSPWTL